ALPILGYLSGVVDPPPWRLAPTVGQGGAGGGRRGSAGDLCGRARGSKLRLGKPASLADTGVLAGWARSFGPPAPRVGTCPEYLVLYTDTLRDCSATGREWSSEQPVPAVLGRGDGGTRAP